jgi:hypothetical protein
MDGNFSRVMDAPAGVRYAYSLYWAIAIIETIGYGDIKPSQPSTVVALLIVMLVGVFVYVALLPPLYFCNTLCMYSYLMGNVTSIVTLFSGLEEKSVAAREEVCWHPETDFIMRLIIWSTFPTFISFAPLQFKHNSRVVC